MDVIPGDHHRNWILEQFDPLIASESTGWTGNRVRNCVPDRFEAYVKIFHAIYADLGEADHDQTWDEWSQKQKASGEARHAAAIDEPEDLRQLLESATLTRMQGVGARVERVRWRRLAEQYGLVFHAELNDASFSRKWRKRSWPKYLIGPDEGILSSESTLRLSRLLARRTGATLCYFTFFPTAFTDIDHPFAIRASLTEIDAVFSTDNVLAGPDYWWPYDYSWCVCTDWDLTFTLVGCSRETADDLLADDLLETIETRPEHRVDGRADAVNE